LLTDVVGLTKGVIRDHYVEHPRVISSVSLIVRVCQYIIVRNLRLQFCLKNVYYGVSL